MLTSRSPSACACGACAAASMPAPTRNVGLVGAAAFRADAAGCEPPAVTRTSGNAANEARLPAGPTAVTLIP